MPLSCVSGGWEVASTVMSARRPLVVLLVALVLGVTGVALGALPGCEEATVTTTVAAVATTAATIPQTTTTIATSTTALMTSTTAPTTTTTSIPVPKEGDRQRGLITLVFQETGTGAFLPHVMLLGDGTKGIMKTDLPEGTNVAEGMTCVAEFRNGEWVVVEVK